MINQCPPRFLVVGAGGNMGKKLVSFLRSKGQVIDLDQSDQPWLKIDGEGGGSGGLDVSDPDQVKLIFNVLGPPLCGVVYLPRVRIRHSLVDVSMEEFNHEYKVVVGGFASILQSLSTKGVRDPDRGLSVVALSSVLGSKTSGFEGVGYHVSKSGLEQLVRVAARELGPLGIRVNAVAPGWLIDDESHFFALPATVRTVLEFIQPLGRPPTYHQLNDLIEFMISERSSSLNGQVIMADGGVQNLETYYSASEGNL